MANWQQQLIDLSKKPQTASVVEQRVKLVDNVLATSPDPSVASGLLTERALALVSSIREPTVDAAKGALDSLAQADLVRGGSAGEQHIRSIARARATYLLASRRLELPSEEWLRWRGGGRQPPDGSDLELSLADARFASLALAVGYERQRALEKAISDLSLLSSQPLTRLFLGSPSLHRAYFACLGRLTLDVTRSLWAGGATEEDLGIGLSRSFEFWLSAINSKVVDARLLVDEELAVGCYEVLHFAEALAGSAREKNYEVGVRDTSLVQSYLLSTCERWEEVSESVFGSRNSALSMEWLIPESIEGVARSIREIDSDASVWLLNAPTPASRV